MKFSTFSVLALAFAPGAIARRGPSRVQERDAPSKVKRQVTTAFPPAMWSTKNRYVIMDNDYGSTAHIPFLVAMSANMTVLGLSGDTANSWALQCSLHALALLEHGNLSCVPVALGEYYPLMMTQQRFNTWTKLWGTLEWNGVYAPENLTYEAEGNDPTSGNANRISRAAFYEGYPNGSFVDQSAAAFMIEQVFKYPGKVSIYAAGSLTNVAAAIRMNNSFASMAKELVIMGGYVDLNLFQTMSDFNQDLGSDINFIIDPEAAHIAITANFPSITVVGNVANTIYANTSYFASLPKNAYTDLNEYYYTALPLWDETAAVVMAFPEVVTESFEVYMDVSTAYDSPFLGGTYVWGKDFAPSHVRKVNYVNTVNSDLVVEKITAALSNIPHCENGKVTYA